MSKNLLVVAALALATIGALLNPTAGVAAPTEITNCADDTEIRAAVADGGDYTFNCSPGDHNIYLTGGAALQVTSDVSLDATGDSVKLVNPSGASATGHVFEVTSGQLTVVNVRFYAQKILSNAGNGVVGTSGTNGAKGSDVACSAANDGGAAGDGGDGTPPLDNATDGADGGDLNGGVIFMSPGTTVNLYGGVLSGSLSAGIGGQGGTGGNGGSGGWGGSPEGKTDCNHDIHGGAGGEATDAADGADGGDGGDARGAGVYVSAGATLNVKDTVFDSIAAQGGPGGRGGNGGQGGWAGLGGAGCGWIVCQPYYQWNGPSGSYSGTGGAGGIGGRAGDARGGAIYSEGTVNLTDAKFTNVLASSQSGGDGGQGGKGGNGNSNTGAPGGSGGQGGNAAPAGISHGGAIYSSGTLSVYGAEFDHAVAGIGTEYGGNNGGNGGWGGQAGPVGVGQVSDPVGGNGGNGAAGGDAIGGSIFGGIDFRGCANFTADAANGGGGGLAGSIQTLGASPGAAGAVGLSGTVDPIGFAPYPCPAGPPQEGPPGSLACKDGVDNDNDKLIDDADPGCKVEGAPPSDSSSSTSSSDKDAPKASLLGPDGEKLGKSVDVTVACLDEACTAAGSGDVDVPKAKTSKRSKLGPATKSIPKGGKATLKLKIAKKLGKAIKKALRSHKKVAANVQVVVTDSAGNKRVLRRKIKLKL